MVDNATSALLIIENIQRMAKERKISIGNLERQCGVRAGYLARLKKDTPSLPSMDFVLNATKILRVSITSIVSVEKKAYTKTELYLAKVLSKLIKDTKERKLMWNEYNDHEIVQWNANALQSGITRPFIGCSDLDLEDQGEGIEVMYETRECYYKYTPPTLDEIGRDYEDRIYYACSTPISKEATVTIINWYCTISNEEAQKIRKNAHYKPQYAKKALYYFDIYITINNEEDHLLYSTFWDGAEMTDRQALDDMVAELLGSIEEAGNQLAITKTAKNVLDDYLSE